MSSLTATYIKSPLGELLSVFNTEKLCLLEYSDSKKIEKEIAFLETHFDKKCIFEKTKFSEQLQKELDEFFVRKRTYFSIEVAPIGTEFQQKVWQILCTIPYGKTISYKQQSELYGDVKAIRAIASANGKNPISILIPCHRVIGSNGKLVGYAGGLHRKQKLLELEYTIFSE